MKLLNYSIAIILLVVGFGLAMHFDYQDINNQAMVNMAGY